MSIGYVKTSLSKVATVLLVVLFLAFVGATLAPSLLWRFHCRFPNTVVFLDLYDPLVKDIVIIGLVAGAIAIAVWSVILLLQILSGGATNSRPPVPYTQKGAVELITPLDLIRAYKDENKKAENQDIKLGEEMAGRKATTQPAGFW